MNMMKDAHSMLTRITARMPRHLYYSIKRFLMLLGSFLAGVVITISIIKLIELSMAMTGSPVPVLVAIVFVIMGVASYALAKIDVDREMREQERIRKSLEKDW
jgi:hypothetical protein